MEHRSTHLTHLWFISCLFSPLLFHIFDAKKNTENKSLKFQHFLRHINFFKFNF